ncbi:hypothetical protein [Flagellimonas profundi]|uniref:Uncharacterized protein n=1 Tax=Flagellimonas profundi TaxID=2915620 RepID=A0ABS3FG66_9FLAO|nr:hypothetical protein [Allomuricauda profundi]MBO0341971.1 hypothetical protein [Allomuricauda profundi]
MIKLFSINKKNKIHHLIEVDNEFIIQEDEFLRLEFGNGFDWIKHSFTCVDCKAFLESLMDPSTAFNWYLKSEQGVYVLDSSVFKKKEQFENIFESRVSKEFTGVRLKLRKIPDNRVELIKLMANKEKEQEFKHCAELKDAAKIAERQ